MGDSKGPKGACPFGGKFFAMTELAIVVQKAYDWNLWILPKVEKFPRSYRFTVGENLVTASLDLMNNLVDASYVKRNATPLAAAVRMVNRIRILVRLAKDLQLLSVSGYEHASLGLDEIGRMTGGWWKSTSIVKRKGCGAHRQWSQEHARAALRFARVPQRERVTSGRKS